MYVPIGVTLNKSIFVSVIYPFFLLCAIKFNDNLFFLHRHILMRLLLPELLPMKSVAMVS